MPAKKGSSTKASKSSPKAKRSATAGFHPLKLRTWPGGRLGALILIAFVAVCGGAFVAFSHAASATGLTAGSTPGGFHICIDAGISPNTPVTMAYCTNVITEEWNLTSNGHIQGAVGDGVAGHTYCLQATSASKLSKIVPRLCDSSNGLQVWRRPNWGGAQPNGLFNAASLAAGQQNCLVDPSGAKNGVLELVGCDTAAQLKANPAYQDQVWAPYSLGNVTTQPTPKPTPKTPAPPVSSNACTNHNIVYLSGSSGTCVGAIQEMVNGIHAWNDYLFSRGGPNDFPGLMADNAYLAVDNSFGQATYTAVKDAQHFSDVGIDGEVGPNTWTAFCNETNNANMNGARLFHPTYGEQGKIGHNAACATKDTLDN